ncbi:hypothetical protein [Vibrio diabolicus]|uniref:hypothetical protein n=1 Tax=Vibrio diabolicus TaxID=50719 RepID=UPI003751018D
MAKKSGNGSCWVWCEQRCWRLTTSKVIASGMGIALAAGPFGVVVLIGVGLGAGYAAAKMGD